ncbi:MAG: leucine-rich repeat domain-containing protein [Chitinispirillia bacterium]|nr:leucine-rich repeat domain-containing protein [Chitinispirillia bacterium]
MHKSKNLKQLPSLLLMTAILVSAFAFDAFAQNDRVIVQSILQKIGRNNTAPDDVAEFSQDGRALKLDLTKKRLAQAAITEFPEEIFRLTSLRGLLLKSNSLTSLPAQIGTLTDLVELDLADNNDLKELPATIGNLTNLKKLDVRLCGLTTLPFNIGNLKSLEMLQLWNNELTEFPHAILELTSLKELYLNNNKLTTLPVEITKMPNLTYIDTQRNALCKLPPAVETWLTSKERRWKEHQWCQGGDIREVR